jgi:hypothetical protein
VFGMVDYNHALFLYTYEVRVDMRLIGCVNSAVPFVRCK